jgi:hypothetical protein
MLKIFRQKRNSFVDVLAVALTTKVKHLVNKNLFSFPLTMNYQNKLERLS